MLQHDHKHTALAIRTRLNQGPRGHYLREWVYGGIDGTVTTFAVVAGVMGAGLSPAIVLILGLANLVGDGFSMAAGAYSAAKTEVDNYKLLRSVEERHIDRFPEGEKEEVRQIYGARGFSGEDLEKVVGVITADRERWIDVMMEGEYGLSSIMPRPRNIAFHTFIAFFLCGAMPLLPFLFSLPQDFKISFVLSAVTFFAIGSLKSFWSVSSWWRHGIETLLIGLCASGLAFVIGHALRGLVT